MTSRGSWACALCFTLALTLARDAAGQTSEDAQARDAFNRGIADVAAQRFSAAADAFETSYRLRPVAVVLFNLASTYARMGRTQLAIATYERYLAEGSGGVAPERVSAVREIVTRLRGELARLTLRVEPTPFTLEIDGRPQETRGDAIELDPGLHAIEVRAAGRVATRRELSLAPGSSETLTLTLEPEAAPRPAVTPVVVVVPAATPHPRAPSPEPASGAITTRWWFWAGIGAVVLGGVVAGMAAGGVFTSTQPPTAGTAYTVSALRWRDGTP